MRHIQNTLHFNVLLCAAMFCIKYVSTDQPILCSLSGELWLHRVHDDGAAIRLPADGPIGKLCVQYSPLDAVLVSSSEDGSLNTWDTATCQAQDSYRMLHKVQACIRLTDVPHLYEWQK